MLSKKPPPKPAVRIIIGGELGELVALETSRRAGRTDVERWKTRREDLVGTLERVYRDLDAEQA